MQYQIMYYSPKGQLESMVDAFFAMLPRDTYVSDLEMENTPYAEVQLVGFDIGGTNLNAIPFPVIEYLEKLDGRRILLFATVPCYANENVRRRIENSVIAFLPDECDYVGLYLCSGQPSDTLLRDLRNEVSRNPENTRAKHWLEQCQKAVGHPDRTDIQNGCRFLHHVLELG